MPLKRHNCPPGEDFRVPMTCLNTLPCFLREIGTADVRTQRNTVERNTTGRKG